jgi:hypothetical protein
LYYVYGEALARILTEKLGITVNPLPTQGPVHNVKLVDSGAAQLGLITMGVGLQGWNGTGDWTNGKRFQDMRALFPMYDTSRFNLQSCVDPEFLQSQCSTGLMSVPVPVPGREEPMFRRY